MKSQRIQNFIIFTVLLLLEVVIALFVHDRFVRPYVGDILVVAVLYFFIRIFLPNGVRWLPFPVFLFAAAVEVMQYFNLAALLGVENNPVLRIVIGSVFDIKDIVCYGAGCLLLWGYEIWKNRQIH